jgi:site-specific DNA-methyltransferase (adenine-specific)
VGPYNEAAYVRYVENPDNVLNCGYGPGEGGLHPTQKPLRLMQALIELTTRPDQIVLDPFAGSGSTLVAAQRTHRKFVGYELDPKYVEICQKRLDANVPLPFTR